MINKIYLNISYDEKDEAKQYGAKWDKESKLWYTDGYGAKFGIEKWIPSLNIIAPLFLLLETKECFRCKQITDIIAFSSNQCFELSSLIEELAEKYNDMTAEEIILMEIKEYNETILDIDENEYYFLYSNLNYKLNNILKNIIQNKFPCYKLGKSKLGGIYIANHCEHCSMIQGNHYIFGEPSGNFDLEHTLKYRVIEKGIIPMNADVNYITNYIDYNNQWEDIATFNRG